jgi:hypothetical protein
VKSSRTWWIAALVTTVAGAMFAVAPIGVSAVPSSQAAATSRAHPTGFFVTGAGLATKGDNPTAFLRDPNGGYHVLTTVRSTSAIGDLGQIVYSTRKPHAKRWVMHKIPGLRPMAGGVHIEIHMTFSGRIFAVFYECDGVYVSETSTTATRFPEPTLVQSADTCATAHSAAIAGSQPIARAVWFEASIAILLRDPTNRNGYAIFLGKAGGPFKAVSVLPTADHFTPKAMVEVYTNNRFTVVGTGGDGTHLGIYTSSSFALQSGWSAPLRIATLNSATSNFTIQAVVAAGYGVWVGLRKPKGTDANQKHTLFLDHRAGLRLWSGPFPLPHSTSHDTGLAIAINAKTNRPHVAFTRVNPSSKTKKSGIMLEDLLGAAGWSKPKFFTHWYLDHADEIGINNLGGSVIGYDQHAAM